MNRPVEIGVKRVQPKVPPRGILCPVLGEGDNGAASVCLDIAAKCRDLERLAVRDRRHRSMVDACRDRTDRGSLQRRDHLFGLNLGRDIDVIDTVSHQGVAHTAADEPRAARAGSVERGHDRLCLRPVQPGFTGNCHHCGSSS